MLDQLFQMIQQSSQQAVVENTDVPNEHNEAVMQEAQNSIISGLSNLSSSGQISNLLESAGSGQGLDNANPAVQQISNNFMGSIMEKFGISNKAAASIAATVIPMVLGKIMNKGQQQGQASTGGGFDLGGLLSSITGGGQSQASGGGGGIMDIASSIGAKLGLDKDGDGDVDMSDLSKLL